MSCGSRGSWKCSGEGEALEHHYCSENEGDQILRDVTANKVNRTSFLLTQRTESGHQPE